MCSRVNRKYTENEWEAGNLSGEMDTLKGNQMGIWELREQ